MIKVSCLYAWNMMIFRTCLAQLSFSSEVVFLVFSVISRFFNEAKAILETCLAEQVLSVGKQAK